MGDTVDVEAIRARASLAEGQRDRALDALERVRDVEPQSPSRLTVVEWADALDRAQAIARDALDAIDPTCELFARSEAALQEAREALRRLRANAGLRPYGYPRWAEYDAALDHADAVLAALDSGHQEGGE